MVGLSVVLEAQKSGSSSSGSNSGGGGGGGVSKKNHPQVISKTTMLLNNNNNKLSPLQAHHSSSYFPTPTFLDQCFLCNQKLLPGKDIYMYKGDRAFCSVECRCRQIFMDEEESLHKDHCSLAAMKPTSSSSSSSSSARNHRKGTRNRAGGFVN
ncbi:FCS-Like Zinc finger 15 [Castanea sativa]|uniref:FCS-Like Zinc finger 15 n=1 Tax=Castanea sativa TaxID=21020 RepID=UPI003F64EB2C